ncbi:MAG: MmgE/PrpD family protein [Burkholderiaceae bacterium]
MAAIVRTATVDTVACVLAGRTEPATRFVSDWAQRRFAPAHDASVLFSPGVRMQSGGAALVNAVSGHALDYDDVALAGHPSVVLATAVWAEHERTGVKGFDLVQAYAKGYAVWAELLRRQTISLHAHGWHPTAIFGVVACAAAVAALRGLSASGCQHAMGIAASMAGGVVANFGSMTKPLQVGRAAEGGIAAADLAQAGFTASPDALEGPAGYLRALAGGHAVDLEGPCADDAAETLLRTPPGIKKYPVCYAAHRVVDGVLDLARQHDIQPNDIASVDASISKTTAGVLRHHAPTSVSEARFSLEYCVAAALLRRSLGLADVSAALVADPTIRRLMPLVRTQTVDTRCPIEPSFALHDRVTITLMDGTLLDSGDRRFARGHAELPLDEAALREKFFGCAGPRDRVMAESLLERITQALETTP